MSGPPPTRQHRDHRIRVYRDDVLVGTFTSRADARRLIRAQLDEADGNIEDVAYYVTS